MDDQLSKLESKVLEAIEIIHGLRHENGELSTRCDDLTQRLQDVEEERERMGRDLNEAREAAAQADQFEQKRRLVEEKVGSLLSKLEAMN